MSIKKAALALYRPPFTSSHGYIFDADSNMVADDAGSACRVRGWGCIGGKENPEALQDAVGEHIAKALTQYWEQQPD